MRYLILLLLLPIQLHAQARLPYESKTVETNENLQFILNATIKNKKSLSNLTTGQVFLISSQTLSGQLTLTSDVTITSAVVLSPGVNMVCDTCIAAAVGFDGNPVATFNTLNVSSVTDTGGSGNYRVNLTIAMVDQNYLVQITVLHANAHCNVLLQAKESFDINCVSVVASPLEVDPTKVYANVYGLTQ